MLYNLTNGDDNYIDFNSSNDTINGLLGNDHITGGSGNDVIDGGPGNDILAGGAGSDVLIGGTGLDIFRDTAAGLNGDHIQDLLVGDRIQITDLNFATTVIGISGSSLTYTDGTLSGSVTIDNLGPGRMFVSGLVNGGVDIRLAASAPNDFNGDGRSDILWRNNFGTLTDWLGTANGGSNDNSANFFKGVGTDWHVAGTGDFNGDGHLDLLWRDGTGTITDWLGTGNGSFTDNSSNFFSGVGLDWQIAGTGDFNGDGHADILWRNSNGALTDWLGSANGSFTNNSSTFLTGVGTDWQIVGTGDFNGDGLSDILWRHTDGTLTDWLGNTNGSFTDNASTFFRGIGTDWQVAGTGDFNGDGIADILWRHTDGTLTDWLGNANGTFTDNAGVFFRGIGTDWQVADIGDYNGDGKDDILWRHTDGTLTDWLGASNGSFTDNASNFFKGIGTDWQVQSHEHLLG